MTRLKKLKLYALSFLFFAGLLALALTLTELIVRRIVTMGVEESRDHVMMTDALPATFKANYEGVFWKIPFKTNNFGFRGEPEMSLKADPDEIRILSLGDSIGFGLGVPAQDHYTKTAQRLLQPELSPRRLQIVNAGGQGYSPSSYGAYLQKSGVALEPSMVVLEIELCNDVTDEALLERLFPPQGPPIPIAVRGGRYIVAWDGGLLASSSSGPYFFERTYLWTNLTRRWLNLRYSMSPSLPWHQHPEVTYYTLGFDRSSLTPARIESGWQNMFQVLQGIHQHLDDHGIPFLLMIMPSRYVFQDAPGRRAFSRQLVSRAAEMAEERSIPFLDMTTAIEQGGGADLFFDFAHLTVDGNRVVGERLALRLKPLLAQMTFGNNRNGSAQAAGPSQQ